MDSDTKGSATILSGRATDNASDNHYNTWSSVTNSYLVQNSDGTLTRLENTSSGIVVENYSADGKSLSHNALFQKSLTYLVDSIQEKTVTISCSVRTTLPKATARKL